MSSQAMPLKTAGTDPDRSGRSRYYVLAGVVLFVIYQVSLLGAVEPGDSFWLFGADNMEELFQGRSTTLAGVKHPLFAVITPPLYKVGRALYFWAPGMLAAKLALVFPVALLGAANTALAFWIFAQNHSNHRTAVLFGLLYGLSATTWVFSSYPDTYVLTALCTSIFIAVLIIQTQRRTSILPVAAANALACFASPQQVFLAVIPFFNRLRSSGLSKQSFADLAKYAAVLVGLFIVPYLLFLEISGNGWKLAPGYVNAYSDAQRLIGFKWYPVVLLNFLVFSVVGPVIHPSLYRDPTAGFLSEVSPYWFLLAALYLTLVFRSLRQIKASPATLSPVTLSLAAFLVIYSAFFLVFNPIESFIYSFPALLPWMLILQTGFTARDERPWQIFLGLLLLAVAINNMNVIVLLNYLR